MTNIQGDFIKRELGNVPERKDLFKEQHVYILTVKEFGDQEFYCIFEDGDFCPLKMIDGKYDITYPIRIPICNRVIITSVREV